MSTSSSIAGSKQASRSEAVDEPLASASPSIELLEFLGEFPDAAGAGLDALDPALDRELDPADAQERDEEGGGVD